MADILRVKPVSEDVEVMVNHNDPNLRSSMYLNSAWIRAWATSEDPDAQLQRLLIIDSAADVPKVKQQSKSTTANAVNRQGTDWINEQPSEVLGCCTVSEDVEVIILCTPDKKACSVKMEHHGVVAEFGPPDPSDPKGARPFTGLVISKDPLRGSKNRAVKAQHGMSRQSKRK